MYLVCSRLCYVPYAESVSLSVPCSVSEQPNPEQVDLNSQNVMDTATNDGNLSIANSQSCQLIPEAKDQKTASECVLGADEPPKNEGVTYSADPRPLHQPENDFDDDF